MNIDKRESESSAEAAFTANKIHQQEQQRHDLSNSHSNGRNNNSLNLTNTTSNNNTQSPTSYQKDTVIPVNINGDERRRQRPRDNERQPILPSLNNSLDRMHFDETIPNVVAARRELHNFAHMSIFFSANHGCVVSCLSLATARLGSVGAWQSGLLYFSYTISALVGATYIVKMMGGRDALIVGMATYCVYVGCFLVATSFRSIEVAAATIGALLGGVGAGIVWTAQGSYFAQAAEEHARFMEQQVSDSNATLASVFAFIYLTTEVILRALSTVMLDYAHCSWDRVFAIYTLVAVAATVMMFTVRKYYNPNAISESNRSHAGGALLQTTNTSILYKVTAAYQLLMYDPKMKYMVGLNMLFGFTSAFLNSYVNGEVIDVVLKDAQSKYIGILSAWVSIVASVMSLIFGKLSQKTGKGPILILGAICFLCVVIPFIIMPPPTINNSNNMTVSDYTASSSSSSDDQWGWLLLVIIFTFHGTGRATFEGTLKAAFADFFPYEKEGAFANIIFQNGLSGTIGYILTFNLLCSKPGQYCVQFRDGTLHDVLSFELLVVVMAIIAIVGYCRGAYIHYHPVIVNMEVHDRNRII